MAQAVDTAQERSRARPAPLATVVNPLWVATGWRAATAVLGAPYSGHDSLFAHAAGPPSVPTLPTLSADAGADAAPAGSWYFEAAAPDGDAPTPEPERPLVDATAALLAQRTWSGIMQQLRVRSVIA